MAILKIFQKAKSEIGIKLINQTCRNIAIVVPLLRLINPVHTIFT